MTSTPRALVTAASRGIADYLIGLRQQRPDLFEQAAQQADEAETSGQTETDEPSSTGPAPRRKVA